MRVGKFKLLQPIGAGAWAEVYRAFDIERDREVSVKIARNAEQACRVEMEGRLAERMRHPCIVRFWDAGRIGSVQFISSAMMRGGTLQRKLARNRLSPREAAIIAARIARALEYVHRAGVVHRDVSPTNVLFDGRGRAYLSDFGLAKTTGASPPEADETSIVGTPAFMSPEQAACGAAYGGRAARSRDAIDARSDVYSLGVVLYETLVGRLPFLGRGRMLLQQIIEDEPPPLRMVDACIPPELERICLTAMSKAPANRYASAAYLAADLQRYVNHDRARVVTKPKRRRK